MISPYPETIRERDRWILAQRTARNRLDPERPYAFLSESERTDDGEVVPVATIFLTNRECPWHCLMCDLWKNTLTGAVPLGAIPAQIDYALSKLSPARQIKLYNSGSFFDPTAIAPDDYAASAERVRGFDRVIVESHPALVGERCLRLRDLLACESDRGSPFPGATGPVARGSARPRQPAQLEVAMGLETAHPQVLEKMNKQMTLDQFSRAAEFLREHDIALRVFILVKPPFLDETEALEWAKRSIDFAFDCGATVASLIPTRSGNGALEALAERGEWSPPGLATLEAATAYGVDLKHGRVFADLWDLERFSNCGGCFAVRAERLRDMNLRQVVTPPAPCPRGVECGDCTEPRLVGLGLSPVVRNTDLRGRQDVDKSGHSI